jgi:predicted nucleic acid-binding Zn ribbon protein
LQDRQSGAPYAKLLPGNYYLRSMGEYSLGEAIKEFLSKSRLKNYMQAIRIEEVWEQIMGKTIAKYTEKIVIQGDKLYITTYVAPLKQELLYQKETIMQRVNEALGEKVIKEVIIN